MNNAKEPEKFQIDKIKESLEAKVLRKLRFVEFL